MGEEGRVSEFEEFRAGEEMRGQAGWGGEEWGGGEYNGFVLGRNKRTGRRGQLEDRGMDTFVNQWIALFLLTHYVPCRTIRTSINNKVMYKQCNQIKDDIITVNIWCGQNAACTSITDLRHHPVRTLCDTYQTYPDITCTSYCPFWGFCLKMTYPND